MNYSEQFTEEHLYGIALGQVPRIGPTAARSLIEHFGNARSVFRASRRELARAPYGKFFISGVNDPAVLKRAEAELDFCAKHNISVRLCNDADFPRRLAFCPDAPYLLFVKGHAELNTDRMIAIVGTRMATDYGRRITDQMVSELAGLGISIISGLALGIDGFAHRACLKNKIDTIGVLGHGHDRMSPVAHKKLAQELVETGAVVTEYLSGTHPDKYTFPSRNRIIAGMADAVVVVESAYKGGALITADIAHSYDRDVFAIPGKATDKFSAGCNRIIKSQKAILIESGKELLEHMGWEMDSHGNCAERQRSLFPELSENELKIARFMQQSNRKIHFDEISNECGVPSGPTRRILLSLELLGVVVSLPGNRYELS